jgi:YbbR domain-containing protein
MLLTIKMVLTKNTPLKVCSFILGYTFWSVFSNMQTITQELTVPLCCYQLPEQFSFHAPETINITLSGKKNQLASINKTDLAVHIDAHDLSVGTHPIAVTAETLFLPESIKLVHYSPVPVIITTTVKK